MNFNKKTKAELIELVKELNDIALKFFYNNEELEQQLEDSKQQAKLFYKQLQEAEAKLKQINELSEEEIDI